MPASGTGFIRTGARLTAAACLLSLSWCLTACSAPVTPSPETGKYDRTINTHIVRIVRAMPRGGGYSTGQEAFDRFIGKAVVRDDIRGRLRLAPSEARPSFCSEACYLVLLQLLDKCRDASGNSPFSPLVWQALAPRDKQPDGEGIWGRANANGPGFAKLVSDLDAGFSFEDISRAKPGDFLKIFWTDEIGGRERGHLVVYLGVKRDKTGEGDLFFWSSNMGQGYSVKSVPLSSAKRLLFTRLTKLGAFSLAASLPERDEWLASLLRKPTDMREIREKCRMAPPDFMGAR